MLDLLIALLRRWVRPTVLDTEPLGETTGTVCYVLQRPSSLDLAALELAAAHVDAPPARQPLELEDGDGAQSPRSVFALMRHAGWLHQRSTPRGDSQALRACVQAAIDGRDVTLVPVSVFWGRAPDREGSFWRLLLSERWNATSGLRRFLGVLFDRTHLFVRFGPPLHLAEVIDATAGPNVGARRAARLLRTHFRKAREALIGPDLSHRRTLVDRVVASRNVRRAAAAHADREGVSTSAALREARRHAKDIASDLSFAAIRFFDILLTWLWTKLYDGIDLGGVEAVKEIAGDHTLIYVPSHRSHMDYLLMSYVLFYNGLMLPHVAAGKNLNIPVVGPLLRRAGAFFMRRSFRDDPLYAAVFEEYLDRVFANGFSVEYFVEGGRSRTGRLLPPRGGMLGMTVRSRLRSGGRPFAFVPVYFGYEKVVEARSYLGELRGRTKQAESLSGVLRSMRFLRQSFGTVHVRFGDPLVLDDFLEQQAPGWRNRRGELLEDEDSMRPIIASLGTTLQQRVNAAASVTPVAALATALLATERQALDEDTMASQLDCLLELARYASSSSNVSVTDLDADAIIAYGERLGLLERTEHALGDILGAGPVNTVLLTWYRNNVLHVFATPSLIAALFAHRSSLRESDVVLEACTVRPFLRGELYIAGDDEDDSAAVVRSIDALVNLGLLEREGDVLRMPSRSTAEHARLRRLAKVIMPTLERWYIAAALIEAQPPATWTAEKLESACVLAARRLARLHGIDAPEFFDATLFRHFIRALAARGVLTPDTCGGFEYDRSLRLVLAGARRVLDPAFCDSVRAARRLPAITPVSAAGA